MRQITKSFIVALLALVALGNTTKAQDLTVLPVSTPSIGVDDTVYRGSRYLFRAITASVDSNGNAFPADEPFNFDLIVDSNLVGSSNDFTVQQDLDSGRAVQSPFFAQTDFSNDSTGEAELKMVVNASADVNPANDTFGYSIYIADYDWDLRVNDIISPDTGNVDTTDGVDYTFVVENASNKVTPDSLFVTYAITLGGNAFLFDLFHQNPIAPGDTSHLTYNFDFSENFANIGQMGDLETCILPALNFTNDQSAGRSCKTITYVGDQGGPGSVASNSEVGNMEVYPNPVEDQGLIEYTLEKATTVDLSIYNMNGQSLKTLEEGQRTAGQHTVNFDVTDLESGAYIYKLQTNDGVSTGRLMVK